MKEEMLSIAQFDEVVSIIRSSRQKAYSAVNSVLIELYWTIGKYISTQTNLGTWGKSVVQNLSAYIQRQEPGAEGFSAQNLWRMKQFYETYAQNEKLSTLVREIGWSCNTSIMSRAKSDEEREFYLKMCIKEHYSYRELDRQISSGLYERIMIGQGMLPRQNEKLSTVLREIPLKEKYVLEFLDMPVSYDEKDLQKALVHKMKDFILELGGHDFTFMGEEFPVQVGNSDFRIDLLFFHRGLQCMVAFELKVDKFRPEHLGQLNFYLEALDRDVKHPNENPSIGILLCKDKDNDVVEYALSRTMSPTMVAEYELQLPDKKLLQQKLRELFQ